MSYKEVLTAFSKELREGTKSDEGLHFFYQQVNKTLNFEPIADKKFLNFYTGVLENELKNLKEGSDLENSINILYSINERVCYLHK